MTSERKPFPQQPRPEPLRPLTEERGLPPAQNPPPMPRVKPPKK